MGASASHHHLAVLSSALPTRTTQLSAAPDGRKRGLKICDQTFSFARQSGDDDDGSPGSVVSCERKAGAADGRFRLTVCACVPG